MKKVNNKISFGMLFNGIFLIGNCTHLLPEFITGVCAGLGLTLIFMGMYAENHDMSTLRSYKKHILNQVLSK